MNPAEQLPPTRFEIYRCDSKKWHWRLISKADVRAKSPLGYVSKQGCLNALNRVKLLMEEAELFELAA